MSKVDSDAAAFADPKRPARITGKVTRRSNPPAIPPPSDEPVPGFGEAAPVVVDEWLSALAEIGGSGGAFAFEIFVSSICAVVEQFARMAAAEFIDGDPIPPLIAELSRRRNALSTAVLTCLGYLSSGELGAQARLAVPRAGARGGARGAAPAWIEELDQPCVVDECAELRMLRSEQRMLVVTLSRNGVRHGLAMMVDDAECGEALMIMPIEPSRVLQSKGLVKAARELLEPRTRVEATTLEPAEARFRLETAVSRRADHDGDLEADELLDELLEQLGSEEEPDDEDENYDKNEEGAPPYLPLLPLLTARLALLPDHGRDLPSHPAEARAGSKIELVLRGLMSESAGREPGRLGFAGIDGFGAPRRKPLSAMPKKRRKSDGPAPVLRVRIDLKGAKPPIWRRLELPGDATLADVHRLIQAAFEWDDYHLHAFETDYGPYGNGDADLGHRDPGSVTLEQLLRDPGDKLEYMYDFGDGWEHTIKLEAVLEPEPGLKPRCTAGRRAAPPEDSGGIWAHEEAGAPEGPDTFDRDRLNEVLAEIF